MLLLKFQLSKLNVFLCRFFLSLASFLLPFFFPHEFTLSISITSHFSLGWACDGMDFYKLCMIWLLLTKMSMFIPFIFAAILSLIDYSVMN